MSGTKCQEGAVWTAGESGFSIIESMVVFVLVGLILVIAAPTLSTSYERTANRAAVHKFESTHELARSIAVRYGRAAALAIDADNGRFWLEVDTSSAGGTKDTIGAIKDISDMGITMTVEPADNDLLCFDVRGIATTRDPCDTGPTKVYFASSKGTDSLEVTVLGKLLR